MCEEDVTAEVGELRINGVSYPFQFFPGDDRLPVIMLIHGYCQSGQETWGNLIPELRRFFENSLIVLERLPVGRPGRSSVWEQTYEMKALYEELRRQAYVGQMQEVLWVGHSLGALIAFQLCAFYALKTRGLVRMAPPAWGWTILLNPLFWLSGGLAGLIPAQWAWLTGTPVRYPRATVHGLFAGKHCSRAAIARYQTTLQPDAGRIFPEVLLTYFGGHSLAKARRRGFSGRSVVVGCTQDRITPRWATRLLAWSSGSQLRWIREGHCWWVQQQHEQTTHDLITAIRWALAQDDD